MKKKRNSIQKFGVAVFYIFLRIFVGSIISLQFRIRHKKENIYKTIRPPYLILSNHASPYDPFWINLGIGPPIHWVVSDANMTNPIMKFLFSLIGSIPKTKDTSDLETIIKLKTFVDNKEVIGIFPEGEQTWTGKTAPINPATSKLLRFLKIPVIVPIVKGGYSVWPRWSWQKRARKITVEHKLLFSAEEIKRASLSEIEEKLSKTLCHDEFEWQAEKKIKLKKHHRAEYIELALFLCPSCHATGTLRSHDNTLRCKECDLETEVDRFGFFRYNKPSLSLQFKTPLEWIEWQEENCRIRAESGKEDLEAPLFPPDTNITLSRRNPRQRAQIQGEGRGLFFSDRIEFQFSDGRTKIFPLETIRGMSVHKQQQVEFFDQEAIWHFDFPSRWISGFKWLTFFRLLKVDKVFKKHA